MSKTNVLMLDSQANNLFSQDLGQRVDLEKMIEHFRVLYSGDFEAHYFYQYHTGMNWDAYKKMVRMLEGFGWIVHQCLEKTNITSHAYAGTVEMSTLITRATQRADDLYLYGDDHDELNLILGVTHLSYAPMLQILGQDCPEVEISLLCNPIKVSPKLQEFSDKLINTVKLDVGLVEGA